MSGFTTVGPITTTSAVRQLSDGNALSGGPGTQMGKSPADKQGFFGAAPVVQPGTGGGASFSPSANVSTFGVSLSPVAIAANTSAEQALTITGVLANDVVAMTKPTAQAGLIIGTARVSAANTVQLTLGNVTAGSITPTATQVWATIAIGAGLSTSAILTPALLPPMSNSEQTFTVLGVSPGQSVIVNKPTAQAGLIITNARVTAANQVAITFANLTAAPITPTAGETYLFASASGFQPAPIMNVFQMMLTPVAVAPNTSAEQTFTVPGLVLGSQVLVTKPSITPGLMVAGERISAANTLAITYGNNTAAAITPPAELYQISYFPTQAGTTAGSTIQPAAKGNDTAALVSLGLSSGG